MAVDYQGATPAFVARNRVFPGQNRRKWLVVHKTAGGGSALDIARFFATDPNMASTHYVVDQSGQIAQCVLEQDGAAGNCCLETGHASFLPTGTNLNWWTISIEHVDPTSDNSTALTSAQKQASFKLIWDICQRNHIPMRKGDANGGIIGHKDIAPLSRARCPGNYPWNELFQFLASGGEDVLQLDPKVFKQVGEHPTAWQCLVKDHEHVVLGAILAYYRSLNGALGLPNTGEHYDIPDYVWQEFQNAIVMYSKKTNSCTLVDLHSDLAKKILGQELPDTADLASQLSIASNALASAQSALVKAQAGLK